jgi:hypothetical protein
MPNMPARGKQFFPKTFASYFAEVKLALNKWTAQKKSHQNELAYSKFRQSVIMESLATANNDLRLKKRVCQHPLDRNKVSL